MKSLVYGNTPLLVCDAVAYTTIDYAVALAQSGLADRVNVPTFDDSGTAVTATIVLAPALYLVALAAADDEIGDNLMTIPPATRGYLYDIDARTAAVRAAP
ncbi:hypothetical protein DEJ23_09620 [Curtobacterium sp. MCSS17_008]|uniref:hypothetical protein n=1 Tax=Curtobacterium sp. MCSS17_008 TaxID=2175647 RepID=UPI000DA8D0D6|nr:hypothetical protein [Curtobacterium sp. MCSS17_008]PZF56793.1 hypothetical protein DEJ23_09620 [Curtobacterium sp. MCSS17_008]